METKKWIIDTTHSLIGFKIKHMMFTNVRGSFQDYQASLQLANDNFEESSIHFEAQAASIDTNNTDRDNHLRSADFLDVEKFPTLTFTSTKIEKKGETHYSVEGTLTMHGVSKTIKLNAEYSGVIIDPWGNAKVALALTGKVNRKDWNLNWNTALEAGGLLVSEEINFDIETQFVLA
ncbi:MULTISPECIES: YceI family protein [unclassified Myroides]|uniref:YceI family protein n=1 Tax=unclassified Myroides TaxID=2642485 RepID=UPI0015F811A4|nr:MULTISPECIES: YceI family protein [unclassified Myroides]MBB1148636.1 YceI family protein [Myroides sp. NP-2]MDM1406347.1 YceI family protein [Myroides sp. DF42-4-2]